MRGLLINTFESKVGFIDLPSDPTKFKNEINKVLRSKAHVYNSIKGKNLVIIKAMDSTTNVRNIAFRIDLYQEPLFGNIIIFAKDPISGYLMELNPDINVNPDTVKVHLYSDLETRQLRREQISKKAKALKKKNVK